MRPGQTAVGEMDHDLLLKNPDEIRNVLNQRKSAPRSETATA
jgi:hypothetical protein